MEEKFKPILEEDEQIVETITLNKTKFFWSVFLASFFILSVVNAKLDEKRNFVKSKKHPKNFGVFLISLNSFYF